MERLSRQQMVAEFGETGVENPTILDLITVDPLSGHVVLVMLERRPWGAGAAQFRQIEEKINRYLGYALDGFLTQHYPQYAGKNVRIRLDCAEPPHGEALRFVEAARQAIEAHGLELLVEVVPARSSSP